MLDITYAGYVIAAITVGMTFLSTLVRHLVLDKEKMKEHKEKIKYHQEQMKQAQKNKDLKGMQKHQESLMEIMSDQMRHNMKPMLFTMIPFLIVFSWMGAQYNSIGTLQNVTVMDALPAGAQVLSAESSPAVNYSIRDGGIAWHLGNLTYPWDGSRFGWYGDGSYSVNVTFKEAPTQVPTDLKADYIAYYVNHTVTPFVAAKGEDRSGSMYVAKSKPETQGNTVSYRIDYDNLNPYYVSTVFGVGLGWLRWYILCSFVSSMIFNKMFGLT